MILIDRPRLKFLLAGREVTVTVEHGQRDYRRGRVYSVGVHHNRTVCRAQLLKLVDLGDGAELTLRRAEVEEPRLLGRTGGYVNHPTRALRDEPEAVDARTQERLTELGAARWEAHNAERENERTARSLAIRIKDAQRRGDADELGRIAREIGRLEARIRAG